jgi:hypothetical protein
MCVSASSVSELAAIASTASRNGHPSREPFRRENLSTAQKIQGRLAYRKRMQEAAPCLKTIETPRPQTLGLDSRQRNANKWTECEFPLIAMPGILSLTKGQPRGGRSDNLSGQENRRPFAPKRCGSVFRTYGYRKRQASQASSSAPSELEVGKFANCRAQTNH